MPVKIGTHQFQATQAQQKLKKNNGTDQISFNNQIFNKTGPIRVQNPMQALLGQEIDDAAFVQRQQRPQIKNGSIIFANGNHVQRRSGNSVPKNVLSQDQGLMPKQQTRNLSMGPQTSQNSSKKDKILFGGALRPNTAPHQNITGIIQQQVRSKRPVSPFTKVYQSQGLKQGMLFS